MVDLRKYLLKEYITVDAVLDMLEDHNYSTEFSILTALKKRQTKQVELLIMISKQQDKVGSLDFDLGALRYYLGNPESFKRAYGTDSYKGMKISASTMKIVKKMDKKQQQEFVGVFKKE